MRKRSKRHKSDISKKKVVKNIDSKKGTVSSTFSEQLIPSENIIRLKVTVRKGARIESVPLKKLERLANQKKLGWKYEDGWLILYKRR